MGQDYEHNYGQLYQKLETVHFYRKRPRAYYRVAGYDDFKALDDAEFGF